MTDITKNAYRVYRTRGYGEPKSSLNRAYGRLPALVIVVINVFEDIGRGVALRIWLIGVEQV